MKFFEETSSRLRKLNIPLPNYTYNHSCDQISDEKFIGREKIRKKLYSLLMQSDSETGSYLITGYRGMGKSSLVNKVLDKFKVFDKVDKIVYKLVRQTVFLLFFCLINSILISIGVNTKIYNAIFSIIMVLSLTMLIIESIKIRLVRKYKFLRIFSPSIGNSIKIKIIKLLQDLFIAGVPILASNLIYISPNKFLYYNIFLFSGIAVLSFMIVNPRR